MQKIEPGIILKERYKIVSQLGQGGMGEVYLAEDLSLATQVALKINHNLSDSTSAQFIREARLLAGLKHPNLPRVIDYFTENESQLLVMDYVPGDDLRTIVERHDKLNKELIIKWAVELGHALMYLHNQKPPIFHRDVKPANIKLTPAGDVVLVDFGIAKTGDPSQETQTGAWAFSPGFAPPEQVSGMRTGPYSDQFSLAATVYYLFAGKPPTDSAKRLMGEELFIPLNVTVPTVPNYISDSISKALSIKPEDRFPSIVDFLTSLTNPQSTQIKVDDQKTVFARNNSALVPPIAPTPVSQPRKPGSLWVILGVFALLGVLTGGYFVLRSLGFIGAAPVQPMVTPSAIQANLVTPTIELAATNTEIPPTVTATPQITSEPIGTGEPAQTTTLEAVGRGGKVAFISNRQGDGFEQVWLMDVGKDTSGNLVAANPLQLTFTSGDKSQPNWSPDGTKLLFTGLSTDFAKNGTPFAKDIWMIDLSQIDPVPVDLSKRAGDDQDPAWSPTGKKIAFSSYYREDGLPQLFIMNADGSEQTRLSERFAEHFPTWTPNDDFLVYVLDYAGSNVLSMRDRWSLYADQKKFDVSSDAGRLGNVSDPQVSLDGSMIVYTQVIIKKQNIFTAVYKDRGRIFTQLTDSGMDYAACWSPDAKWILFTSERDGNSEIYIMDASGKELTDLTNHPAVDKDPAWQPPQP